jgi:hypothetical protein
LGTAGNGKDNVVIAIVDCSLNKRPLVFVGGGKQLHPIRYAVKLEQGQDNFLTLYAELFEVELTKT